MKRTLYIGTIVHGTGTNFYSAFDRDHLFAKIAREFALQYANERPPQTAQAIHDACEVEEWHEAIDLYFHEHESEAWFWGTDTVEDDLVERFELVCDSYPVDALHTLTDPATGELTDRLAARQRIEGWLRARDVTLQDAKLSGKDPPPIPSATPRFYPATLPPETLGRLPLSV